ncbi:MAG TPA: HAMP domain-containing sensor histidine kinase [Ktedonobacteraceae bacterium]|nr:HAMP domain-containing sensor histidine kinase [Ktedonobacteraceae bacterium]
MKQSDLISGLLRQIYILPISWLSLSRGKRLLIVTLSYVLGIIGLWYLFPLVHNGASMFVPIVSACWLFRYRGLIVSVVINGIVFQLTYIFLLRGILPDQAFLEGGVLGFGTSLGLGIVVCWLRTAVDQVHQARRRVLVAEQRRLQALQGERQAALAYEQQCRVNELKDQFLLNVSHELRTPLTVLGGSLELLDMYDPQLDPMKRDQVLKDALRNYKELVELVDRVMDATTVVSEIPQAKLEAVCLYQLVQEVLTHLSPEDVEAYSFRLEVPEQIMVRADRQFLHQVLRNLLSNIFKYVPRQTEIRIEVMQEASSSPVCLSVQDSGPGIPAEELPQLFEKFVRLKRDLAGTTRGTGLGLYICKQLVEAMGGHIWVESSGCPGEGSHFYVTLPSFSPNPH